MKQYIELGCSPYGEDCVQVSKTENYYEAMIAECKRYKALLKKKFESYLCTGLISFKVKTFPHDFGTYAEVIVYYDDNDEKAEEMAYNIESNSPEYWIDK